MPPKELRIAVAGCGHLGSYHLQKVRNLELETATDTVTRIRLCGAAEPQGERGQRIAEQYKIPVASSYTALCDNLPLAERPNALIVATPTERHWAVCKEALAYDDGVHLLVEKPLASLVSEGAAIVAAAESAAKVLHVGHSERFNPAIEAALKIADAPRYIVIERLAPFSGRSTDIDVIYDLMIHDLDLVGALLALPQAGGLPGRVITAEALVEVRAIGVPIVTMNMDMTAARLEFDSGAVAQLSASRASMEPSRKIRLFTKERYISIDAGEQHIKSVRRIVLANPPAGETAWPQLSGEPIEVESRTDDALTAQLREFIRGVVAHDESASEAVARVDGRAALRALRWAEAVQQAVDKNPVA